MIILNIKTNSCVNFNSGIITCPLYSIEFGRLIFQGSITWIVFTQMSALFDDFKGRTVYQNTCMSLSRQLCFHTEWQPQQSWSDTVVQDSKCVCPREQARNSNTFHDPVLKVTQVSFPQHSIVESSHKLIQIEGGRGTQTPQLDGMNAAIFGKQSLLYVHIQNLSLVSHSKRF